MVDKSVDIIKCFLFLLMVSKYTFHSDHPLNLWMHSGQKGTPIKVINLLPQINNKLNTLDFHM